MRDCSGRVVTVGMKVSTTICGVISTPRIGVIECLTENNISVRIIDKQGVPTSEVIVCSPSEICAI